MSKIGPYCRCLDEIENNLPRTKFCRMPCSAQDQILANRKRNTVQYGDYVQMNDRFETVHIWSKELEEKNAGRWIPKKISKWEYNAEIVKHPLIYDQFCYYIEHIFIDKKPTTIKRELIDRNQIEHMNTNGFWGHEHNGLSKLWIDMKLFKDHMDHPAYKDMKHLLTMDINTDQADQ